MPPLPDIRRYDSYARWLTDWLEVWRAERGRGAMSSLAAWAGCSPTYLRDMELIRRDLRVDLGPRLAAAMSLGRHETALLLWLLDRERAPRATRRAMARPAPEPEPALDLAVAPALAVLEARGGPLDALLPPNLPSREAPTLRALTPTPSGVLALDPALPADAPVAAATLDSLRGAIVTLPARRRRTLLSIGAIPEAGERAVAEELEWLRGAFRALVARGEALPGPRLVVQVQAAITTLADGEPTGEPTGDQPSTISQA